MLPPEIQNDPEVIQFVSEKGKNAEFVIGIGNGNGVVLLGVCRPAQVQASDLELQLAADR